MLLPEGKLENFYTSAQLHSFLYVSTSKVGVTLHSLYWFWCTQTYHNHQLFSTTCTAL